MSDHQWFADAAAFYGFQNQLGLNIIRVISSKTQSSARLFTGSTKNTKALRELEKVRFFRK